MRQFVYYEPVTGGIRFVKSIPAEWVELNEEPGLDYIEHDGPASGQSHYVDVSEGVVKPKDELDIMVSAQSIPADGISYSHITDIPTGVTVSAPSGAEFPVADGEVVFSTPEPGEYRFRFFGVKWLDKEIVIHAS